MTTTPEKVVVRSQEADDKLTIVLNINGTQRNLSRPKDEALEKPLMRIQKSAAPPVAGGSKAKKHRAKHSPQSVAAELPRTVLHDSSSTDSPVVDGSLSNDEAWQHGRLLRVGNESYVIDRNPPTIEKLEVHGKAVVGCPVLAMATLQFANSEASQWAWHRRLPTASAFQPLGAHGPRYVPVAADAGCMLRVECTPAAQVPAGSASISDCGNGHHGANGGVDETQQLRLGDPEAFTFGPVEAGPGSNTPTARRHALTAQPLAHPDFRVVTYNILADQYASSEKGINKLFSYCPRRFLDASYRRPLILAELLGFNADIVCLQEVDEKAFAVYFRPHLTAAGFEGVYTNKAGKTSEGSATFWQRSRFAAVAQRDLNFRQIFAKLAELPDGEESRHAALLPLLRASPHLQAALQRVGTIAQLVLLRPVGSGGPESGTPGCEANGAQQVPADGAASAPAADGWEHSVCVLNTHLFFHPRAPHIRTLHVAAALEEADSFIAEATAQDSSSTTPRPALLLCGDLNSDLNEGIPGTVELLRSGALPADFWDWREGADFKFGRRRSAPQPSAAAPSAAANGSGNATATDADEEELSDALSDDDTAAPSATSTQAGGASSGARSGGFGARPVAVDAAAFGSGQAAEAVTAAASAAAAAEASPAAADAGDPATPGVVGVDLRSPFSLAAADDLRTEFTNYVRGYVGALDYVWYQPSRMAVKRQIPLPSREDVAAFLPSERFPSDHLSVVFDMAWRSDDSAADSGAAASGAAVQSAATDGHPSQPLAAELANAPAAVQALQREGVIAIPTDTLYGFAALASSSKGIAAIYAAKQRQLHSPLAICVGDAFDIPRYAETEHLTRGLLRALLPGPVTVVLRRRQDAPLSADLNPGVETIGVRMPDHGFTREVCRRAGGALALTSANLSGSTSPLQVREFEALWPACAAVFDGGRVACATDAATSDAIADGIGVLAASNGDRSGSCIVNLCKRGTFQILRRGAEPAAQAVIGVLRAHGLQQS